MKIDFHNKQIVDMDGDIYRVCQYTWSNFIRKNKPHWEGIKYYNKIETIVSDDNFENDLIKKDMYQKLRQEIMYLSKTKREITVLFYYENKSGDEISKHLGIPASTVRWHLGNSRKILKERIEMAETIYTPKRLTVYFCGSATDFSLKGLRNDLLVHNICIACREKALTIEEIASTLCMAAAYIEDKLEPLIYMNYIRKVGSNRYQTNFFIKDEDFFIAQKKFEYENIPPITKVIFDVLKENLDKIRKIGFIGCDLNENFLMWTFVTSISHKLLCDIAPESEPQPPIRGDGSSHWIEASISEEDILKNCSSIDPELKEYILYSGGFGAKHSGNDSVTIQQFDMKFVGNWRGYLDNEVRQLYRVHKIIKENSEINENDKGTIAELAQKGYIQVDNGIPRILIPYLTFSEKEKLNNIIYNDLLPKIMAEINTNIATDYANYISKMIPDYLPKGEKEFVSSRFYEPCSFSWLPMKDGYLKEPTNDEKKRMCTIIWETK